MTMMNLDAASDATGRYPGSGCVPVVEDTTDTGATAALLPLLGTVLEDLHCGVILLDGEVRIRFVNQRARRILKRADAMIATTDGLRFLQPTLQKQFTHFLSQRSQSSFDSQPRLAMRVPRKSGLTDYALVVRAVARSFSVEEDGYVVLVYDFERDGLVEELLNHVYGFTAAEARLASHLYNGLSVQATAQALCIRESTARVHLTKVLSKCGVRSLTELLQRLALGPLAQ